MGPLATLGAQAMPSRRRAEKETLVKSICFKLSWVVCVVVYVLYAGKWYDSVEGGKRFFGCYIPILERSII